jgi:drug/metabolite transporter (DMT)-like permease
MSRRAWGLFVLVGVLWGIPYLLIRVAVVEMSPIVLVFLRTALAAAVLVPLALATGAFRGLGRRLGWLVLQALVQVLVPFLLISYGELHVTSSMAGVLIASEPILIALLAPLVDPRERVRGLGMLGLLLGLAGVAAVVGLQLGGDRLALLGAGLLILAAGCYAIGMMLIRLRLNDASQVGSSAVMMVTTAALLAIPAATRLPARVPGPDALVAVALLALLSTAIGFLAMFALVQEAGAGRAALVTYVNPAVAVLLGAVVLSEPIGPGTVAGFVLIVAGSVLAGRGRTSAGGPA